MITASLDRLSDKAFLIANLTVSPLAFLTNTVVLIFMWTKPDFQAVRLLVVSVALGALLITLAAAYGLMNVEKETKMLMVQVIILGIITMIIFFYIMAIFIRGFPNAKFSWTPGVFTLFCGYTAYLMRRILSKRFRINTFIDKLHWVAIVFALPLDIAVMVKMIYSVFA